MDAEAAVQVPRPLTMGGALGRLSREREGLSSSIAHSGSFAMRRVQSSQDAAAVSTPRALLQSNLRGDAFPLESAAPSSGTPLRNRHSATNGAVRRWHSLLPAAGSLGAARLLAATCLICLGLPVLILVAVDAHERWRYLSHPVFVDNALQQVRARHLRSDDFLPLSGWAVPATYGCTAAAAGDATQLVVCDPTVYDGAACSAAATLGFPVLSIPPMELYEDVAHFMQLLARLRALRRVVFVGDTAAHHFARFGFARRIRRVFPQLAVATIDVGGVTAAKAQSAQQHAAADDATAMLFTVTRSAFGLGSAAAAAGAAAALDELPAPPMGVPPALTFREFSPCPFSGDGSGVRTRAAAALLVVGDSGQEWSAALYVAMILTTSSTSADALSPTSMRCALDVEMVSLLPPPAMLMPSLAARAPCSGGTGWTLLNASRPEECSRLLSRFDAVVVLASSGRPLQWGRPLALPLHMVLSAGTTVLLPAAQLHADMSRAGAAGYGGDPARGDVGKLQAAVCVAAGRRSATAAAAVVSPTTVADSVAATTTATSNASAIEWEALGVREGVRRRHDEWYGAAAAQWRAALALPATRVSDDGGDGVVRAVAPVSPNNAIRLDRFAVPRDYSQFLMMANGSGDGSSGSVDPLLPPLQQWHRQRRRGRRRVALYVSELAPVSSGGAGVVATALVVELLGAGVDVVVIAALPCESVQSWHEFVQRQQRRMMRRRPSLAPRDATADSDGSDAAAVSGGSLSSHCTSALLADASLNASFSSEVPLRTRFSAAARLLRHEHPLSAHGIRHSDVRAAVDAANAVVAAYAAEPFDAVEFFDFFGPAFEVLRRREAMLRVLLRYCSRNNGSESAGAAPPRHTTGDEYADDVEAAAAAAISAGALPLHVLVLVRAHGTMEAINEIEVPGRASLSNYVRHFAERYALAGADAVLVQSAALRGAYARAYGLERARVLVAPPPVPAILAMFQPQQHPAVEESAVDSSSSSSGGGGGVHNKIERSEHSPASSPAVAYDADDGVGVRASACSRELASFPAPCRSAAAATTTAAAAGATTAQSCVVFLALGKMQRVKGPLTLARGFATLPPPSASLPETHLVYVGGDAYSSEHGHHVSRCVLEPLPRSEHRRVHIVPFVSPQCVGAAVYSLRPVAAVFGSEFESFHLAAHELASLHVPLVLPRLPVYDDAFERESVYQYDAGNATALGEAMRGNAEDAAAGRPLRTPKPAPYGDAVAPYAALLGVDAYQDAAQPPSGDSVADGDRGQRRRGFCIQEGSSGGGGGVGWETDTSSAVSRLPAAQGLALGDALDAALYEYEVFHGAACRSRPDVWPRGTGRGR